MGFYANQILPHLIDLTMRNIEAARLRSEWIPHAYGAVLEVGIGSGLNLPFYSSRVNHLYGLDPSLRLQQMARKRVPQASLHVDFLAQSAEDPLPLDEACVDTAVMTWTLCSIPNAPKALQEIRRVLKPGGHFIFIEHGRSPDARVSRWQDRLTPVWMKVSGGCHLNRSIDELLAGAGFNIRELRTCYLSGPRPMTYTYQGLAEMAATERSSGAA